MKTRLVLILSLTVAGWSCQTSKMQAIDNSNPANTLSQVNAPSISSNKKESEQNLPVDYYAHIKPEHREILKNWLETKKYLRPAVEEVDNSMFQEKYKDSFEQNMKTLRDSVGQNGYQYYSVGDMNADGKEDFAVLLTNTRNTEDETNQYALAIFNAPFNKSVPAYFEDNLQGITNSYINFDRVSKRHLFLGKFESGVYCATYYPKKKTYYFKDCYDQ